MEVPRLAADLHLHLNKLSQLGESRTLQWIAAHVGTVRADNLAREGRHLNRAFKCVNLRDATSMTLQDKC